MFEVFSKKNERLKVKFFESTTQIPCFSALFVHKNQPIAAIAPRDLNYALRWIQSKRHFGLSCATSPQRHKLFPSGPSCRRALLSDPCE
jgi:hypothetical protein